MADEPIEERQERELDGEHAEPEEADDGINFRVGRGIDVGKVRCDRVDSKGGIGLHEDAVKARIEDAGARYRGCHGEGEEGIVYIKAFEAAIADDCPAYSNAGG